MFPSVFLMQVALVALVSAKDPEVVGSSGAHAQMAFALPGTSRIVFLDNFHVNFGDGIDLATGKHSDTPFVYPNTDIPVFGTEYDLDTNTIRPLKPISNTFCSAGAFLADGTLLNTGGAEPCLKDGNCFGFPETPDIQDGFDKIRTFASGNNGQDWVETGNTIQKKRWYHSMQTLTDGSVALVGGSNVGSLVTNMPDINEPNYEKLFFDGRKAGPPVDLPILAFTDTDTPDKSYNLYPLLHLLPNDNAESQVMTISGNQAVIWDYIQDKLVKTLPNLENPRTFPSSAMSVLLPLRAENNFQPEVLVCGGCSGDAPNPIGLKTCERMAPLSADPVWEKDDDMPTARVLGNSVLLPSGDVFFVNGASKGSGGGFMAEDPVLQPVIYNPLAAKGSRFTIQPATKIPRMYHSVAILTTSGAVLVAGSNPAVFYDKVGTPNEAGYPNFYFRGKQHPLNIQQSLNTSYPTEYRVELFFPPYMDAASRPVITDSPAEAAYNSPITLSFTPASNPPGKTKVVLVTPGFTTHGVTMGQRSIELATTVDATGSVIATAPANESLMPRGMYMLFVVEDNVPSVAAWITLKAGAPGPSRLPTDGATGNFVDAAALDAADGAQDNTAPPADTNDAVAS